jgi:hypothetical protein
MDATDASNLEHLADAAEQTLAEIASKPFTQRELLMLQGMGVTFAKPGVLFEQRLERAGRLAEYQRSLEAERAALILSLGESATPREKSTATTQARLLTMRAFGYAGATRERALYARWMVDSRDALTAELVGKVADGKQRLRAEKRAEAEYQRKLDDVMPLPGAEADFNTEVRWCFNEFVNVVRPKQDGGVDYDLTRATSRAPSSGAIALIRWGAKDETKFFALVFRALGKTESVPEEGDGEREAREDPELAELRDARTALASVLD